MRLLTVTFIFILTVIALVFSCKHEPDISTMPQMCFNTQVLPIFQSNCAYSGCHDSHFEDGLILTDYTNIINAGITPGNAKNSKIYKVITDNYGNFMPPKNPLSEQQRQIIELWINQGAKNTICSDTATPPTAKLCFNQDVLPILLSNCAMSGCHDATTQAHGINLTNYSSIMAENELVIPNNPDNSKLIKVLAGGEDQMPPSGYSPLTQTQINILKTWISDGATNDNTCVCDTSDVTFAGVVAPIISSSCQGCHSGSSPSGGISLLSYTDIKAQMDNGKLWNSINIATGTLHAMPPSGKLSNCNISKIRIWKDAGAPNN